MDDILTSTYQADLDQTRVSWAGSTTVDGENTPTRSAPPPYCSASARGP